MLNKRLISFLFLLALLLSVVVGCSNESTDANSSLNPVTQGNQSINDQSFTVENNHVFGQLKVHFIDVGQADSILVQFPNNQNMLIDAGNNNDGNTIVNYLHQAGVYKIDYLVGTHPHEDHIGGMDTVIQNINIGKVFMPKVTTNTKTFEDVLNAIQANGLKITTAKAGVNIINAGGLNATMLAPNSSSYEDLNNYSAVIKLTYDKMSFLLTGDAEEQSESEMLTSSAVSPKADVLKVGHHGSHSSTSPAFFKAVNPQYAVISVGTGNDYSHPHKETLKTLSNVNVYRTDLYGTIVFSTDGSTINVSTSKNIPIPSPTPVPTSGSSDEAYLDADGQGLIKGNINSKGEKIYHMPGGAYYDKTDPEMLFKTEEEAQAAGFRASKR